MNDTITSVPGIEAGHCTDLANATGCTVILCRNGAVGGVDVRGGSPGTRETNLLEPTRRVDQLFAVALSGGSAFGLDAASGVMAWLEGAGRWLSRFGRCYCSHSVLCHHLRPGLGYVQSAPRPAGWPGRLRGCFQVRPYRKAPLGAGTGAHCWPKPAARRVPSRAGSVPPA